MSRRAIYAQLPGATVSLHTEVSGTLHVKFKQPIAKDRKSQHLSSPESSESTLDMVKKYSGFSIAVEVANATYNWAKAKTAPTEIREPSQITHVKKVDRFGRTFFRVRRLSPEDETEEVRQKRRSEAGVKTRDFVLSPKPFKSEDSVPYPVPLTIPLTSEVQGRLSCDSDSDASESAAESASTKDESTEGLKPRGPSLIPPPAPALVHFEYDFATYEYLLRLACRRQPTFESRRPIPGHILHRLMTFKFITEGEAFERWLPKDWDAYNRHAAYACKWLIDHPRDGFSPYQNDDLKPIWATGYPWIPYAGESFRNGIRGDQTIVVPLLFRGPFGDNEDWVAIIPSQNVRDMIVNRWIKALHSWEKTWHKCDTKTYYDMSDQLPRLGGHPPGPVFGVPSMSSAIFDPHPALASMTNTSSSSRPFTFPIDVTKGDTSTSAHPSTKRRMSSEDNAEDQAKDRKRQKIDATRLVSFEDQPLFLPPVTSPVASSPRASKRKILSDSLDVWTTMTEPPSYTYKKRKTTQPQLTLTGCDTRDPNIDAAVQRADQLRQLMGNSRSSNTRFRKSSSRHRKTNLDIRGH